MIRPPAPAPRACIWCSACADYCPRHLQPQLLVPAINNDKPSSLVDLGLADCFECGACEVVCPSEIPLLASLRRGRAVLAQQADAAAAADAARTRYERKIAREQARAGELEAQRQARRRRRRERQASQTANPPTDAG